MESITPQDINPDDYIVFLQSQQSAAIVKTILHYLQNEGLTTDIFTMDIAKIDTKKLVDYPYTIIVGTWPNNINVSDFKQYSVGLFIIDVKMSDLNTIELPDYIVVFSDTEQSIKKRVYDVYGLETHWDINILNDPNTLFIKKNKEILVFNFQDT